MAAGQPAAGKARPLDNRAAAGDMVAGTDKAAAGSIEDRTVVKAAAADTRPSLAVVPAAWGIADTSALSAVLVGRAGVPVDLMVGFASLALLPLM